MGLLDDNAKKQITQVLMQMVDPVSVVMATQQFSCGSCKETEVFLTEVSSLSPKLSVKLLDFEKDKSELHDLGLDKVSGITLLKKDKSRTGVFFFGTPGGYEVNSFLMSLLEASGKKEMLAPEVISRIKSIDKDVDIKVFVTLGCPYCPQAVISAHRIAMENDRISASMIEASTFNHMAIKYNVSGVPKIVVNGKHELVGAQPIEAILDVIEKV